MQSKSIVYRKNSGLKELDDWAKEVLSVHKDQIGYPLHQEVNLKDFYAWYTANGLESLILDNVGNSFADNSPLISSDRFEKEVIEFFAPLYGFDKDRFWGMVSSGGTDGNNHGIYFGVNYLRSKTGKMPVMYVSDEAHYSNARLADLQNLDLKIIKSDKMGKMIPEEFEKALDTTRPCLIVFAVGSTFRGAIDDQRAINAILERYPEVPVYRHVDAALFGGYLPFTRFKHIVDRSILHFDSIAISGHKFFGVDEPTGIFITTKDVFDNQSNYDIPYLNQDMKMISCSRSSISPLKLWWLIHYVGYDGWSKQAEEILDNTEYLKKKLDRLGWPNWKNDFSNTIFIKRPLPETVKKYRLACGHIDAFGGDLSHVVVMKHVNKKKIDELVRTLEFNDAPICLK